MRVFLTASTDISVPLEEAYQAAYRGVPRRWREVLDIPPESGSRTAGVRD
jgi:hypothetical protein